MFVLTLPVLRVKPINAYPSLSTPIKAYQSLVWQAGRGSPGRPPEEVLLVLLFGRLSGTAIFKNKASPWSKASPTNFSKTKRPPKHFQKQSVPLEKKTLCFLQSKRKNKFSKTKRPPGEKNHVFLQSKRKKTSRAISGTAL
jgi:hypothetical protein